MSLKNTFLTIVVLFLILLGVYPLLPSAAPAFGAPISELYRSIIPETTNKYYIGTTTPSSLTWLGLFTQNASTTNLSVTGQTTGCAQFSATGALTSIGVLCGTGSSSFGKTWELSNINGFSYLSPTTTVPIQINSTATSTFNGALLVGTTTLPGDLLVQDRFRVQDNRNDFMDAGVENASSGPCATAEFDAQNNMTTLSNHFAAFGITGGNFTGSGCVNTPYTGFGPDSSYILNPNGNINFALGTSSSLGFYKWFSGGYDSANTIMTLTKAGYLGIGSTTPDSPLTISPNLISFAAPQIGTLIHIIETGRNARISADTYANSALGSIFQGLKARGTNLAPLAVAPDDTISLIGGDGWGGTGFHSVSVGAMAVKASGQFTTTSAPTYLSFFTTSTSTISAVERVRIDAAGATRFIGPLQASSTALFTNGFTAYASSTLQGFTAPSGSIGALTLPGIINSLLATNSSGLVVASSTIGNNQLQNSSIVVTTASPLGGAGTISLGGTLALTCTGCLTSAVTSVTGVYPVQSTGGNTPAISLAFGTTTNNNWSGVNTFLGQVGASTTALFTNGFTTYASSTLQNFTANVGTFLAAPIFSSIIGTQCLHVTGTGQVSGTGSDCGSGGSGVVSAGIAGQLTWYATGGTTVSGTSTNPIYVGSIVATTTATSTLRGPIVFETFSTASTTATSTMANGLNLSAGCFSIANTCIGGGSGGAVSSVSNTDGTLTISPTTGSVAASINLANRNSWTGKQFFSGGISASSSASAGLGYRIDDRLFAYSSTTNGVTILGIGSGGQNATTSTSLSGNTSVGYQSMMSATNASKNTAVGYQALANIPNVSWNTAVGYQAGLREKGNNNTFVGDEIGNIGADMTLDGNTGVGAFGFAALTSGSSNTYVGNNSLIRLTTGAENLSLGNSSGNFITTGGRNIVIGGNSGGVSATNGISTTNFNILIGAYTNIASSTLGAQLNIGNGIYGTNLYSTPVSSFSPPANTTIGIATTSPFARFAIAGGAGNTNAVFAISTSTATFATSTALIVDLNGNLALGTNIYPSGVLDTTGKVFLRNLSSATNKNALCIDATTKELFDSGGLTCALSSKYLKKDIRSITSEEASRILDVRPIKYSDKDSGAENYGFIAEELNVVDPLLADHAAADVMVEGHLFNKGEPIGANYLTGWAMLTKFVQDQDIRIQAIESFADSGRKSVEENWQNILIGMGIAYAVWNEYDKRKIRKTLKKLTQN